MTLLARRSFARLAQVAADLIDRMANGEISPEQALTEWREIRTWEEQHIENLSTSPPLRKKATGKRPFKLVFTEEGLLYETYSTYGSEDAAKIGAHKLIKDLDEHHPRLTRNGWWVVLGPDRKILHSVGTGRAADKDLPTWRTDHAR